MATEPELRDAFYAALIAFVDNECGRTGETAVKRLGVGKNIISDARKGRPGDFRRPHDKTLEKCFHNGTPALSVAAKQLADFRLAEGDGAAHEFNFLYAGMQLVVTHQCKRLLVASIDRGPQVELEQLAATGLTGLYAMAQYCRAQAAVCGTNVTIGFPKLLVGTGPWGKFGEPRASDEGCDAIARELLELASKDDIALSRKLDLFERVPVTEEGDPLTVLQGAQAMLSAGLSHFAAHEVAQTFILDGRKHPSLRQRPLYALSAELFKRLARARVEIMAEVERALEYIAQQDAAEAAACLESFNAMILCVSGNRSFAWLGERSFVSLTKEGVTFTRTGDTKRSALPPPRSHPRPATLINDKSLAENPTGESFLIVDDDKFDVYEMEQELAWPADKIHLFANHKLRDEPAGLQHVAQKVPTLTRPFPHVRTPKLAAKAVERTNEPTDDKNSPAPRSKRKRAQKGSLRD